jgi:hypothetical protein
MILLTDAVFEELDTRKGVLSSLQTALAIEHATIPAYLYAYFSIDRAFNPVHANVIRSIVREEMGHFALVCNLINALGGTPEIDTASFVPAYPAPLPGGVEADLRVRLAPLSTELLHDVFMKIEEPEKVQNFRVPKGLVAAVKAPLTIGGFYARLEQTLEAWGDAAFTGDPSRQLSATQAGVPFVREVTDLASAKAAIELIVDQGEGTGPSPEVNPDDEIDGDYAHYYKFAMLFHGRRLIRNPAAPADAPSDEKYIYGGDPIPLAQEGVRRVPTNPKAAQYAGAPEIKQAVDAFNTSYRNLLGQLHQAANGEPTQMGAALTTMKLELAPQAETLVTTPLPAALATELTGSAEAFAAPTFEYPTP